MHDSAPDAPPRAVSNRQLWQLWQLAALAGVVLLAVLRSMLGTSLDGFTLDEPYHLLASAAYAEQGAYHLNPEHPPLVKRMAGAALAPLVDVPPVGRLPNKLAERNFAERIVFLEHDGAVLQRRARLAMYVFHGTLLLMLLLLARRVFGFGWTLVLGAWLALDPTVGAHLPLVMTDLSLALMLGVAALVAVVEVDSWSAATGDGSSRWPSWVRRGTWAWTWTGALGLAIGLCLGTKHSALPGLLGLLVFCVVCIALAIHRQSQNGEPLALLPLAGRLLVVLLLASTTLWAQYDFRFHAAPDGSDPFHQPIDAKIDAVASAPQRAALRLADRLHLAPRAYLWGLADTVRAGVEGRGQDRHVLFGRTFEGEPPWFFWPGILLAKVPLPHLLLSLLGVAALLRWPPPRGSTPRAALVALGAVGSAHFLALATSRGTYGGVRHALPLLLCLGVVAAGVVQLRRSRWPRGAVLVPALLLTTTFAVTIGEPRLWEYHSRLAGGTADAAERFDNEGVRLGQRLPELARTWHDELGAPDTPIYALTPLIEEEAASLRLPVVPRVRSIHDENVRGLYRGFFLIDVGAERHRESLSASDLSGLEQVVRLGNLRLLKGEVESPQLRVSGLLRTVGEYLNQTRSPDWDTLARRMEELVKVRPDDTAGWILLGNCRVALGQRQPAVEAFRSGLGRLHATDPYRERLEAHLDLLESGTPLAQLPFLPIPSAE